MSDEIVDGGDILTEDGLRLLEQGQEIVRVPMRLRFHDGYWYIGLNSAVMQELIDMLCALNTPRSRMLAEGIARGFERVVDAMNK